jgi:hypothetical protein
MGTFIQLNYCLSSFCELHSPSLIFHAHLKHLFIGITRSIALVPTLSTLQIYAAFDPSFTAAAAAASEEVRFLLPPSLPLSSSFPSLTS